jgi:exonuclease SbcD
MGVMRVLFLADTHLGFDYPFRPRSDRRRRGEDFFANYARALEPAERGEVDAVIHGGDFLFRSKVSARLVDMALAPLKDIADKGVDIFIVPGNHERSRIPFRILSLHPHIHVFDVPRTFMIERRGIRLGLAGFPYWRDNVRAHFSKICEETGWREHRRNCDGMILCVHHCFEGATVGPGNYTFRSNEDVVRIRDIPKEFLAVLSGHIHRFQILIQDLKGQSINTPILYPGSIERTSFAEKDEPKGYLKIELRRCVGWNKDGMNKIGWDKKGIIRADELALSWEFIELPARPMICINILAEGLGRDALANRIRHSLKELNPDSVVKLNIRGKVNENNSAVLRANCIRTLSSSQMNISLRLHAKERIRN